MAAAAQSAEHRCASCMQPRPVMLGRKTDAAGWKEWFEMAGMTSARSDGGNRWAVARCRSLVLTRRLRQLAVCAVGAAAVSLPVGAIGSAAAQAAMAAPQPLTSSWTPLTLQNGWSGAPFGTSAGAARVISGIVHLKGAIATTGTNPVPFTLPAGFRPAKVVFVAVDLCNATNGRLQIEPTGVVTVEAEGGAFSNAACFTSLDGVSFAP